MSFPAQKIMLLLGNNNQQTNSRDIDLRTTVNKEKKSMQVGTPMEREGGVMPRGGTISQRGFLIFCEGVM